MNSGKLVCTYNAKPNTERSVIRFHDITHDDMKNGPGLRVVLWVAGCEHHCKDCQNRITWDPDGGVSFEKRDEEELFNWLGKPWTQGITFSGGDPLHPKNRLNIGKMAEMIKKDYPDKDIWLYTGYTLKNSDNAFRFMDQDGNSFNYPHLKNFDVLVDGRFDTDLRAADIKRESIPKWRGSSNQRLIDIKKSLKTGNITEWRDDDHG